MYLTALALSAGTTAATLGLPYIDPPSQDIGGIPIQAFGVIVAVGVLIGAAILRRYAEWHGVSDDHIRGLTGWITITGFIGAHVFDVLAYEPQKLDEAVAAWPPSQWPVLLRVWDGISSYGGFVGGAAGFAFYVWWKRLPARLMADIAVIGLLPAFSIGRIGCTVVSDHIGAIVDTSQWYAFLAMDYPRNLNMEAIQDLVREHPNVQGEFIRAWNLGLIELLYLIPVNALIIWLGFRSKKRMPAGFLVALTGVLYAPVRFFLDYLRPEVTDSRHFGFTFAQWCSFVAFGAAAYLATRILKNGKPAEVVAPTSREAQARLKMLLRDDAPAEKTATAKVAKGDASPSVEPADESAAVDDKAVADAAKPAPKDGKSGKAKS